MPRVIVLDPLSDEGLRLLQSAPEISCEVRTGLEGETLRAALAEFDAAICRSGVKITAEALRGNRRLRAIARAGVGTDNIDLPAATRQGIVVMNTPSGNTLSTAEHTLALMLALSRNLVAAHTSLAAGRWDRKKFTGTQLAGKTLGVIGLGRVGQAVASRARAFEMRVLGYDPLVPPERAQQLGVEPVANVRDMLPLVDYLTVHTPLTKETENLIGHAEIELLKPGARLINAARGGIYNEDALVQGLKSGKLGGVALDVFVTEPCTNCPLFSLPNVLVTPHLGASTEEAQALVAIEAAELLVNYLTSDVIRHAVNIPSTELNRKLLAKLHNELRIAYRLGILLSQWHEGVPRACRLCYQGEAGQQEPRLITAAFCLGLLEKHLGDTANLINVTELCKDRGIHIEQTTKEAGDFRSLISADLESDRGVYHAAGTVFGEKLLRLVRLGNYRLESFLEGTLLVFAHRNVPGIIGHVGTVCGRCRINIAQMTVGQSTDKSDEDSIGVLFLESSPSEQALVEIGKHPDIHSVKVLQLPPASEPPPWLS
jgi:D-3-phosphoglycerate dehydrogenase